jgi:hypothetical protein
MSVRRLLADQQHPRPAAEAPRPVNRLSVDPTANSTAGKANGHIKCARACRAETAHRGSAPPAGKEQVAAPKAMSSSVFSPSSSRAKVSNPRSGSRDHRIRERFTRPRPGRALRRSAPAPSPLLGYLSSLALDQFNSLLALRAYPKHTRPRPSKGARRRPATPDNNMMPARLRQRHQDEAGVGNKSVVDTERLLAGFRHWRVRGAGVLRQWRHPALGDRARCEYTDIRAPSWPPASSACDAVKIAR